MDSPIPGLQYVMGTDSNPELYDTIVMANLVSPQSQLGAA